MCQTNEAMPSAKLSTRGGIHAGTLPHKKNPKGQECSRKGQTRTNARSHSRTITSHGHKLLHISRTQTKIVWSVTCSSHNYCETCICGKKCIGTFVLKVLKHASRTIFLNFTHDSYKALTKNGCHKGSWQ